MYSCVIYLLLILLWQTAAIRKYLDDRLTCDNGRLNIDDVEFNIEIHAWQDRKSREPMGSCLLNIDLLASKEFMYYFSPGSYIDSDDISLRITFKFSEYDRIQHIYERSGSMFSYPLYVKAISVVIQLENPDEEDEFDFTLYISTQDFSKNVTSSSKDENSDGADGGLVIGLSFGGFAMVSIIIVVAYGYCKRVPSTPPQHPDAIPTISDVVTYSTENQSTNVEPQSTSVYPIAPSAGNYHNMDPPKYEDLAFYKTVPGSVEGKQPANF